MHRTTRYLVPAALAFVQAAAAVPLTLDTRTVFTALGVLLIIGGLLVITILEWNRQLRRLVRERTAELEKQTTALAAEVESRQAVEESQARLASIVEATSDFVAIADNEGKVSYINRAGRHLLLASHNHHRNVSGRYQQVRLRDRDCARRACDYHHRCQPGQCRGRKLFRYAGGFWRHRTL